MGDTPTRARVRKADPSAEATAWTGSSLPPDVLGQAGHRLGTAALIWSVAYVLAVAANEYLAHRLGGLPPHGWNVGHTALVAFVLLSTTVYMLSRSSARAPEQILEWALAYEVVGGFVIAAGTSSLMVWDERAHILGLSWVCVWIAGFPFIVPARPARAAAAAFSTAVAAFLGLAALQLWSGTPLPSPRIWSGFIVPTMICAGVATAGSRIVYGLGREIERARAMGAYELQERLGAGGMGEIWRGRHRMLARPAAIKLVRPDAFTTSTARQAAVARFEREAQLTAALSSPHTVRLYDFGVTDGGTFYYAMELLEGLDLEALVGATGPVPPERAVHFLIQACQSLAEAHDRGLVHRDIKPSNLFVSRQGLDDDVLKVLDFGLVRPDRSSAVTAPELTGEAVILGTPAYLAPESATGGAVGPHTDLYALGCVGYFLLTGRQVFDGATPIEMVLRHVRDAPPPVRALAAFDVPEVLELAVMRCLAKNPSERPASAEALEELLRDVPLPQPWTRARARQAWLELRGQVPRTASGP